MPVVHWHWQVLVVIVKDCLTIAFVLKLEPLLSCVPVYVCSSSTTSSMSSSRKVQGKGANVAVPAHNPDAKEACWQLRSTTTGTSLFTSKTHPLSEARYVKRLVVGDFLQAV